MPESLIDIDQSWWRNLRKTLCKMFFWHALCYSYSPLRHISKNLHQQWHTMHLWWNMRYPDGMLLEKVSYFLLGYFSESSLPYNIKAKRPFSELSSLISDNFTVNALPLFGFLDGQDSWKRCNFWSKETLLQGLLLRCIIFLLAINFLSLETFRMCGLKNWEISFLEANSANPYFS